MAVCKRLLGFAVGFSALLACAPTSAAAAHDEGLLGDFWQGKAHFEQVGEIALNKPPYNAPQEDSGWVATMNGKWYLFDRDRLYPKPADCPHVHTRIVVRESSDQGRTWSNPATVVASPGDSPAGDGCQILDGSSYFDRDTNTWHIIVQCMDTNFVGRWSLCHYSRVGVSPMGPFTADRLNPVVRNRSLWSQICQGEGKACDPGNTNGEGTPDIVEKKNGYYYVTFHGWDPKAVRSYRGVAKTRDFHDWIVDGPELPNDAILAPEDCQNWTETCIGIGESTSLVTGGYQYMLAEAPNKSLLCTPGQDWVFGLVRAPRDTWPKWSGAWQEFSSEPLLRPSWPGPQTSCGLQYARWIHDGEKVYVLYEDWGPKRSFGVRRLLKLVPGGGPPVVLKPFDVPQQ
jgi:hypothetical protein